jgi:hypothetical protein
MFLFAVTTVIFFGCTKDTGEQYTIKGKLLKSCDNPEPIVGQNLILEKYTDGGRSKYETIGTTTTDENGIFSIKYSSVGASSALNLKPQEGSYSYLANIPTDVNIEENVYTKDNFFYIIKIKTTNAYTEKDTLFYTLGSDTQYLVGPFTDNQAIDTVVKSNRQGWSYGQSEQKILFNYTWKLGSQYNDPSRGNVVNAYLTPCKKYDEVVLDLTKAIK